MSSLAFVAAADAWRALLAQGDHAAFLHKHFDTTMAMAVALAQPNAEKTVDWDAVRDLCKTDEEEQTMLALVFAIQDVVEVVVRENLAFLVDDALREDTDRGDDASVSASQRDTAALQDAMAQRLPEGFRLTFLTTLRTHWASLRGQASHHGVRLNRLTHMSWRVARPYVLLRIVTSDHAQRIVKVPMAQFHQLRYSAAKVLQEMHQVEAHPIMRLTNLEQTKTQPRRTGSSSAVASAMP